MFGTAQKMGGGLGQSTGGFGSQLTNNNNSTSENTKIGKIASPELNDKQNKDRKNSMDIGSRKKE